MGDALIKTSKIGGKIGTAVDPVAAFLRDATHKKFGDPVKSITSGSNKRKVESLEAQTQGSLDRTNLTRRSLLR